MLTKPTTIIDNHLEVLISNLSHKHTCVSHVLNMKLNLNTHALINSYSQYMNNLAFLIILYPRYYTSYDSSVIILCSSIPVTGFLKPYSI
jgi:hypothetical protein